VKNTNWWYVVCRFEFLCRARGCRGYSRKKKEKKNIPVATFLQNKIPILPTYHCSFQHKLTLEAVKGPP